MKSLRLLLPMLAVALLGTSANAQSLSAAADELRGSLKALSGRVDEKVDRGDLRAEIQSQIDRARGDLKEVRDGASQGARRDEVAGSIERAREHTGRALSLVGQVRSESLRSLSGEVRSGLGNVEAAFAGYGGRRGYGNDTYRAPVVAVDPLGGVSPETMTINLAKRAIMSSLGVFAAEVNVNRVERIDRGTYRAYAAVQRRGPYMVDVNPYSKRVYTVAPLR